MHDHSGVGWLDSTVTLSVTKPVCERPIMRVPPPPPLFYFLAVFLIYQQLSVVEYDPENNDLKTVSLHYFEDDEEIKVSLVPLYPFIAMLIIVSCPAREGC